MVHNWLSYTSHNTYQSLKDSGQLHAHTKQEEVPVSDEQLVLFSVVQEEQVLILHLRLQLLCEMLLTDC